MNPNINYIPTRDGNTIWRHTTIKYILQNERYAGNVLLQKKYSTDTLPRQKKWNRGEKQQYYVTGSNPPIIKTETFEAARALILRRREKGKTGPYPKRHCPCSDVAAAAEHSEKNHTAEKCTGRVSPMTGRTTPARLLKFRNRRATPPSSDSTTSSSITVTK